VEQVVQELLQLRLFHERGHHEPGRRALAIRAHRIRLPQIALAADQDDAAEDVEEQVGHAVPQSSRA
jgi:hypothetical protein